MGDGFTAAQYGTWPNPAQGTVLWHADRARAAMKATPPFNLFAHLFTVYVVHVDTPSGQAGLLGTVNSARWYTGGNITSTQQLIRSMATIPTGLTASNITMIQVLVNARDGTGHAQMTWSYGLTNPINIARTSLRFEAISNINWWEIIPGGENVVWPRDETVPTQHSGRAWHGTIIHEFGHSFGKLVDEHSDQVSWGEHFANSTSSAIADNVVKWRHWFGHERVATTPTRFPNGWAVPAVVSNIQGESGCLMRASWGYGYFCGVCRAELIRRMVLVQPLATRETFHGRSPTGAMPNTPTVTIQQGANIPPRILDSAFHGNTSLHTVTIPASVTEIQNFAFLGATGLRVINNNATTPQQINRYTFAASGVTNNNPNQLNRANIRVNIPEGTYAAYRAAGWTGFNLRPQPVTMSYISGVSRPIARAAPVTEIITSQYTGTVEWDPWPAGPGGTFIAGEEYTATISLYARDGYTMQGVPANFFNVEGAMYPVTTLLTFRTNRALVTANFPETLYFESGDGSDYDPFIITERQHFKNIAHFPDSHFTLDADIELTDQGELWIPLPFFAGHLNGANHTVSFFRIQEAVPQLTTGLFRGNHGLIVNLNVIGSITVTGNNVNAGLIAGINHGGIVKCTVQGRPGSKWGAYMIHSVFSNSVAGGLAGFNLGVIFNCVNYGNIYSLGRKGPFAGINTGGGSISPGCVNYGMMLP